MRNEQAIFPEINQTPTWIVVVAGVTRVIRTPLNLYRSCVDWKFHHVYARITLCKIKYRPRA